MDIELCIILDRLVGPYYLLADLDLLADRLSAVRDYLRL